MASVDGKEIPAPFLASHQPSLPLPFPSSFLSPLPLPLQAPCVSILCRMHIFYFCKTPYHWFYLFHYVSDSFPSRQFLHSGLVARWIFNLLLVIAAQTSENVFILPLHLTDSFWGYKIPGRKSSSSRTFHYLLVSKVPSGKAKDIWILIL